MADVFAGFVVGYVLALLLTPLGAIALVRANDRSGFAQRIAPPGTNVIALAVVLHTAAFMSCTAVGLLLGLALDGIDARRPADGIGSPNLVYTLMVVALTAVLVIPAMALSRVRPYALGAAAVFVLAFGWAMPWLAQLG